MRDIFEEMQKRFKQEMERMERLLREFRKPIMPVTAGFREPLADIQVTDKEVIINVELPGIDKEDVQLNITEDSIDIKAEKKKEIIEKKKGYFRQERGYAGFRRYFSLPVKVIPEKAEAKLEKGVLRIRIPRAKPEKKKKKEIKVKIK